MLCQIVEAPFFRAWGVLKPQYLGVLPRRPQLPIVVDDTIWIVQERVVAG